MNDSSHPAAAARLARQRRIHALRMRVVAIAVALFVAAWVGLYVQLVTGHDPALASSGSSVATQSADPSAAADSSDGGSATMLTEADSASAPSDAELTGSDAGSVQSSAPTAVTTGQS